MATTEFPQNASTIENIDGALRDHIDGMNLRVIGNKGWKKMPVIWVSAERAYQTKHNKDSRDSDGSLVLPILTIERTSVDKSLTRKGSFYANIPPRDERGDSITIVKRIKQDKTRDRENALAYYNRKQLNFPRPPTKTIYQYASIPMPVYLNMTYQISVRTQYQQQMNQALAPFWTNPGGINYFTISREGFRYEAFTSEAFKQENNLSSMGTDERTFETKFDINVLGFVFGADANQETPNLVLRESIVDVTFTNERSVFGDIPENISQADLTAIGNGPSDKMSNPGIGFYANGNKSSQTKDEEVSSEL